MSDFYQNGVVTVLHRLGQPNADQLERELMRYGRVNPIALVLPSLYAELGRPALKTIVNTLKGVSYLTEIVISLDRASALEFRLAKQFFSALPQRVRLTGLPVRTSKPSSNSWSTTTSTSGCRARGEAAGQRSATS